MMVDSCRVPRPLLWQILGSLLLHALLLSSLCWISSPAQAELPAGRQEIPMEELMSPNALPDVVQGVSTAPVTLVEYASLTCYHCADFHQHILPKLKEKYIEAGKLRYILREFPLDPLATAGFMLARCATDEKRDAVVDLLFTNQKKWAFSDKPLESLQELGIEAGFTKETFEACLNNEKLYEEIKAVRQRAAEKFRIDATPAFFFNGVKYSTDKDKMNVEKIGETIEALASKASASSPSPPTSPSPAPQK